MPQSKGDVVKTLASVHQRGTAGVLKAGCVADSGVEAEDVGLQPHEVDMEAQVTTNVIHGKRL